MMRSLYSAVSGLKNHQIKMDVIGNNIANVNTTGFKKSTVEFATALSQTLRGASEPSTDTTKPGGTNAVQIGLGSTLNAISQDMTQGSSSSTGKSSDLMIQGSGFFVLQSGSTTVYTRDGAFKTDGEGYLVDANGARVVGSGGDGSASITEGTSSYSGTFIKIDPTLYGSYTIDASGAVTATPKDGGASVVVGNIAIATFANDSGLTNVGQNYYRVSNNSGDPTFYDAGGTAYPSGTTVVSGYLEMSNVDLSSEFTDMITAQRGFQANSRVITVSDSLLEELINLKRQ